MGGQVPTFKLVGRFPHPPLEKIMWPRYLFMYIKHNWQIKNANLPLYHSCISLQKPATTELICWSLNKCCFSTQYFSSLPLFMRIYLKWSLSNSIKIFLQKMFLQYPRRKKKKFSNMNYKYWNNLPTPWMGSPRLQEKIDLTFQSELTETLVWTSTFIE